MDKQKIEAILEGLKEDCEMALSGEWDRSDGGFKAMLAMINDALEELNK